MNLPMLGEWSSPDCAERSNDTMNEKKTSVKDVLVLNERVLSTVGIWPLSNSYTKFVMCSLYLFVHLVLTNMDLYDAIGNLKQTVENIMSNTVATTTFLMFFLLRFNKMLKNVISMIKKELAENDFQNNNELQLYLYYNQISRTFGLYAVRGAIGLGTFWYLGPMLHLLMSGSGRGNDSNPFVLPFRDHPFLDCKENLRNYVIMYIYQFPVLMVPMCHTNTVSLILNLVLHVCGRFAILSYRIQNITTASTVPFHSRVKELVNTHLKLITMANAVNSALGMFLMIDLIQTSIRMGVLIYILLLLIAVGNVMKAFTIFFYIIAVTSFLYVYSYIGERLAYESTKVADAYYDSNWLKLPMNDQKLMLLCMVNGQKTLYLTAGKVYSFSLFGFIGIMKTSLGFVSLLRTVIY